MCRAESAQPARVWQGPRNYVELTPDIVPAQGHLATR